jgi:hypothetical protein
LDNLGGVAAVQDVGGQIRHLDKARHRFTRSGMGPVDVAGLKWDKADDLGKRKSK